MAVSNIIVQPPPPSRGDRRVVGAGQAQAQEKISATGKFPVGVISIVTGKRKLM